MKIDKIIFLVANTFCERDHDRFGVETLKDNGFEVEIWDLAPIFYPRTFDPSLSYDCLEHRVFYSKKELLVALRRSGMGDFMICLIRYDLKSYFIYRAVSARRIPYAVWTANSLPVQRKNRDGLRARSFFKMPTLARVATVANLLFLNIPFRFIGIRAATLVFEGGEQPAYSSYPIDPRSETIRIHSFDYDIYLREKGRRDAVSKDSMAVFLDEYVPFHPDYMHMGVKPFSEKDDYYPAMRNFFRFVEAKYKVRVVIAAHPKADYENHPDYFEGRPVVKNRTAELVRDSSLVMAHSSTAINFSVLFKKPLIFITTDRLDRSPQKELISVTAASLGKVAVNIDHFSEDDLEDVLAVDEKAYDNYRNTYIKQDGSVDAPFWQAVSDRLKEGIRYP
ncbi:MAG: hypothetical protein WC515_07425 [Candidatus Omnitrophota bacterium]